jgi:hypothetical protein
VVEERILEERYACRKMADWTSKGREHQVRNQPVELPRFGMGAAMRAGWRDLRWIGEERSSSQCT